jgi:hypothetical protein
MKARKDETTKQPSAPFKESILLTLTKTLINLKLRLAPMKYKEYLKQQRLEEDLPCQQTMKDCIVRLVHLTPSVYLEEIFQRIDGDDSDAMNELFALVQLAESQQLCFSQR